MDMGTYVSNCVLSHDGEEPEPEEEDKEEDAELEDKLSTLLGGLLGAYPDDSGVGIFARECSLRSPRAALQKLERWFTS